MNTFRKYAVQLAGGALALGALAVMTPRAAHAVAAAMVEIVNTAANPAITHETAMQASQLVYLTTTFASAVGNGIPFQQYIGGGSVSGTGYTVPQGQNLVITAIDFTSTCSGPVAAWLSDTDGQYFFKNLSTSGPANAVTHYEYPSGLVIAAGRGPSLVANVATQNGCYETADLHGYLTAQ